MPCVHVACGCARRSHFQAQTLRTGQSGDACAFLAHACRAGAVAVARGGVPRLLHGQFALRRLGRHRSRGGEKHRGPRSAQRDVRKCDGV
jgi:hypothetical protein